jgi:hypothetical protein
MNDLGQSDWNHPKDDEPNDPPDLLHPEPPDGDLGWLVRQEGVYQSYMLRLWRSGVDEQGVAVWRARLEAVATHERHYFSSVSALSQFLNELCD